jgi:chromosome segregation ATPase
MKNLDRNQQGIPAQAKAAYIQGNLRQDLDYALQETYRLQDEKDALADQVEQERSAKQSFQARLAQAMQDLEISLDERSQALALRDKAIASRKSMIGRLGGLTASNNRLREKVESLVTQTAHLQQLNKIAVEQVVAANQRREAFQEAYTRVKTAYQNLKTAHQALKTEQQGQQAEMDQLQSKFERLKTGCRRLKTEYERLQASYEQDMQHLSRAYRLLTHHERSRLTPELRYLLDHIESTYS